MQYIEANDLKFLEGCVVKRVTRHNKPTGKGRQDIEKAIHELQILLELRYPVDAEKPLTEAERLEIYNRLQAQARNINVDLDVQTGLIKPRNHPAWPDDKDFRWMAQDADGRWFGFTHRPREDVTKWVARQGMARRVIFADSARNAAWRDTLIERGADE